MNPLTQQLMRGARSTVEYVGFAASGQDSGSDVNCTVTMSSGFKQGDLLVAYATQASALSSYSVAAPAGWTSELTGSRNISWIIYDGSTTSYTWVSSFSANLQSCIVACFRNAYFDVCSDSSALADSPVASSINISEPNSAQIVCASNVFGSTTTVYSLTGFTQIEDMVENESLYTDESPCAMFYKLNVNVGATGSVQVTGTFGNNYSRASQFSLRPR